MDSQVTLKTTVSLRMKSAIMSMKVVAEGDADIDLSRIVVNAALADQPWMKMKTLMKMMSQCPAPRDAEESAESQLTTQPPLPIQADIHTTIQETTTEICTVLPMTDMDLLPALVATRRKLADHATTTERLLVARDASQTETRINLLVVLVKNAADVKTDSKREVAELRDQPATMRILMTVCPTLSNMMN